MGSCQSTESASGSDVVKVTNNKNAVSPSAERGAPNTATTTSVGKNNSNNKNGNCGSTDPVNASQHSLEDDESVKSFSSQHSRKSDEITTSKNSKKNGDSGYSSGGSSAPRRDSGSQASVGDHSSVGSLSGSRHNGRSLGHSSSVIGLDSMIENRREEGGLTINMVHMEVPFGKPIEEVYDGVHSGPVLGSGISGLVRLVTHKATGVKYAVKCLDLGLVDTAEGLAQLREEIFIMCQLDHPNIVRLEEVYESHSEIYLVQELCLGGELFDRLDEQPDYHYTEAECARLVKQMLSAVRYLHSKGIIHRDLKLENFLFSSTNEDSELKMIDFGLSKHFRYGEVQHQAVGTPYTVAPEVIKGSYDERCDIWAIGVIAFLLFSGEPPFGGCGGPEPLSVVRSNILNGDFSFEPEEIWDVVSEPGKDFIEAMLVVDPKNRPTAKDAQKHPWLQEWATRSREGDDNVLNPNVVKALVNFKEFSDMRKLLCEVLSFTLLPDQISDLRKQFELLDTDGSGEISLTALKQVLVTNAGAGSLGALTESEVEDIFNAMRVNKTVTRIHWHEFIAAGLSQCQVDDRNLRLAFERLDGDHKGYVTLDDIMDLLGSDALHNEEMMRKMWGDSMKAVNCSQARITYDDFLLLMKGQTRETVDIEESKMPAPPAHTRKGSAGLNGSQLLAVPENIELEDTVGMGPVSQDSASQFLSPLGAAPDAQIGMDLGDGPLSMDDDDDLAHVPAPFSSPLSHLTPPTTPIRGANDYISPVSSGGRLQAKIDKNDFSNFPELPTKSGNFIRKRSRSMDDDDKERTYAFDEPVILPLVPDVRRAIALPESEENGDSALEDILNDKNKSALQVNRTLYRAHRQMRHSVLEACKLFEEQQARHARDILMAQQEENEMAAKKQAGLVMRRVANKTIPSEAVKKLLEDYQRERHAAMAKATKCSGRGKHTRKKTISDMSGMMGSATAEELMVVVPLAGLSPAQSPEPQIETDSVPSVIKLDEPQEPNLRGATVPGEFRKVKIDPFGAHGKYGRLS